MLNRGNMKSRTHRFYGARGAAAMEFALAMFPLLILILGGIQLALLVHRRFVVTNATYNAVHACATLRDPTSACVDTTIENDLAGVLGMDNPDCTVVLLQGAPPLAYLPPDPDPNDANPYIGAQTVFACEATCRVSMPVVSITGLAGTQSIVSVAAVPYVEW